MRIWPNKTVDQEFSDLGTAGAVGSLNDRQFGYLRNVGYTGALPDMLQQLIANPISGNYLTTEDGNTLYVTVGGIDYPLELDTL